MDKRLTVALGLIAVLWLACGCSRNASPTTTTGRVIAIAASSCPRTVPTVQPAPSRPDLADELVPPGPVSASVCRYEGLNGPVAAGSLVRSHVVSGPALDNLVALFDSPQWQVITNPAGYFCPLDNGAKDVVRFIYTSGPSVDVSVDLEGCTFASNGVRTVAGSVLGQRLGSLVGSASR